MPFYAGGMALPVSEHLLVSGLPQTCAHRFCQFYALYRRTCRELSEQDKCELSEYPHQKHNIQYTTNNKDDRTDDIYPGAALLDIAFCSSVLRLFARLGNIVVCHNDSPSLALCMLIIDGSGGFMFFKYVT